MKSKLTYIFILFIIAFTVLPKLQNMSRLPATIKKEKVTCVRSLSNFVGKMAFKNPLIERATILMGRPSVLSFKKGHYLKSLFYDIFSRPLKTILPFYVGENILASKSQKIFNKLWRNNKYLPSESEIDTLAEFGKIKYYMTLQDKLLKYPKTSRTVLFMDTFLDWAKWPSFFSGLTFAYVQFQDGLFHLDEFFKKDEKISNKNKVQILIDSVPFPHLAIRLGSSVYSYGHTHLSKTPVNLYFEHDTYIQLLKEQFDAKDEGISKEPGVLDYIKTRSSDAFSTLLDKAGLSDMPRSLQVVTLNITDFEYHKLKMDLESHRAKRYTNITFVNDCVTMIVKSLNKNTSFYFSQLIDASPGQLGMELSLMRLMGDPRVSKIEMVDTTSSSNKIEMLARNTYIHMLESKLFLSFYKLHQTIRIGVDSFVGEDSIQSFDREVLAKMEQSWRKEILDIVKSSPEISSILLELEVLSDFRSSFSEKEWKEQLYNTSESVDSVFKTLIQDSKIEVGADSYREKKSRYKQEYLETEKEKIFRKIELLRKIKAQQ